jgi:hypothetical protein
VHTHLHAQPVRDRASELFGSLLIAALVATIASFLICLCRWTPFQTVLFLWMAVVSALASWAVMIPAKIAEGRVEDQAPMRFTMLILGALVGAVACGLAEVMFVGLPVAGDLAPGPHDTLFSEMFSQDSVERLGSGYDSPVKLPLSMYAAYFAFTFAILRWWKLAECARTPRVGFWSTAKCAGFAWLVTLVSWFPQPLGLLLAAAVAFSVQLSSPWLSANRRRELVEQQQKAQFA